MEEKLKYYYALGRSLHKLYNGELLDDEELNLIANSSNDDCMTAFHLEASERLTKRTDMGFRNFLKNMERLKFTKFEIRTNGKSK